MDFRVQFVHEDGSGSLRYCGRDDLTRVILQMFKDRPGTDARVTAANVDPASQQ